MLTRSNEEKPIFMTLAYSDGNCIGSIEMDTNVEKCKSAAKRFADENPGKKARVVKLVADYCKKEVIEDKYPE